MNSTSMRDVGSRSLGQLTMVWRSTVREYFMEDPCHGFHLGLLRSWTERTAIGDLTSQAPTVPDGPDSATGLDHCGRGLARPRQHLDHQLKRQRRPAGNDPRSQIRMRGSDVGPD